MKLHLPINLRKALLALYSTAIGLSMATSYADNVTIGSGSTETPTGEFVKIETGSYWKLNGGSLNTSGLDENGYILIGGSSRGTLELSTGSWTQGNQPLTIGFQENGDGILLVTGDSFSITNTSSNGISLGQAKGTGTIKVNGGDLTVANAINAGFEGGTGKIELVNGTLTTDGKVTLGEETGENSGTGIASISKEGTWNANGGIEIIGDKSSITNKGGTLNVGQYFLLGTSIYTGSVTLTGDTTATGTVGTINVDSYRLTVGASTALTVNNALDIGTGDLTVFGTLNVAKGLTATGKIIGGDGTINVGSKLNLSTGSFGGTVALSAATVAAGTVSSINLGTSLLTVGTGTALTVNNALDLGNGNLTVNGTLNVSEGLTATDKTISGTAGTINVGKNLNLGTIGSYGGAIGLVADTTATGTVKSINVGDFHLTVASNTELTVNNAFSTSSSNANLTVNGTLNVANGLTATDKAIGGNGTINVGKTLNLGTGSFGGTVALSANTTATGTVNSIDVGSYRLTVAKDSILNITNALNITGDLTVSGTLNVGEGLTATDKVIGGTTGTINVGKTLDLGSTGSYTGTASLSADTTAVGAVNAITINGKTLTVDKDKVLTVTKALDIEDGNLAVIGTLTARGGLTANTISGNGTINVGKTLTIGTGSFGGDVILTEKTTAEGTIGSIETQTFNLTIDRDKELTINGTTKDSTIDGGLAGKGTLTLDAAGRKLTLNNQGGFNGTLVLEKGEINLVAGIGSPLGTLTAIDVNGGWMEVTSNIKTSSLTVDATGGPSYTNAFLFIGEGATLTITGAGTTTLNGLVGLGTYHAGTSLTQGNLVAENGDLTINQLDEMAYGTLSASGHKLTLGGIVTGSSADKQLTLTARNIVIKPTTFNSGFEFVTANATESLEFSLDFSKLDIADSSLTAGTLKITGAGTDQYEYVQINNSTSLALTTGTTVSKASLVFSHVESGTTDSFNLKALSLSNGANLLLNEDTTVSFDSWSDTGNTGSVILNSGSLSQNAGQTGDITINSTVEAEDSSLETQGSLTLAGSDNNLDGNTIHSDAALTLSGSYTALTDSDLQGNSIVLDSDNLGGSGLSVAATTSVNVKKTATLANSYVNTLATTVAKDATFTLRGAYTPKTRAATLVSELGDIDLTAGDNELVLEDGTQANFKTFADAATSSLEITDSALTQTNSTDAVTINGSVSITNTADDEQAKLTTSGDLSLLGNNTIQGVEGATGEAIVSSDKKLTIGKDGKSSSIEYAKLTAGEAWTLAGETTKLDNNTISGTALTFNSTGDGTVTVDTLVSNLPSASEYSDVMVGTDNAITGTSLTVSKSTQLNGGTLALSGSNITTSIAEGTLLELNGVSQNATPGSVLNLGSISLQGSTGLTTLLISNGTLVSASSLTMTATSLLAIDGGTGKLNTSLTLSNANVLAGDFAGISLANNAHLVFTSGDLIINTANQEKIKWDASSAIKTLSGNITFDGVKDDLTAATPVRGEIVTTGSYSISLLNGSEIYTSGVTTHNLNLHDADTILKVDISDKSGTEWTKMRISDTLSMANGAELELSNKATSATDLGTLGSIKANKSAISLAGDATSDDYLSTSTIELRDSSMEVTDLELRDQGNSSISLLGTSTLTLDHAMLTGYSNLSLSGASSATLTDVTFAGVGSINMASTGSLTFAGTNDLGFAMVTMLSGTAAITGTTTGDFTLSGGTSLILGTGTDDASLIGTVTLNGGKIKVVNINSAETNLGLNTGTTGGTLDMDVNQVIILKNDGDLFGSGRLNVTGLGTLAITGTNANFTGDVNFGGTTLFLEKENSLGSGTLTFSNDGVEFFVTGTQNNNMVFSNKTLTLSGNQPQNDAFTLSGNLTGGTLNVSSDTNVTFSGTLRLKELTADDSTIVLSNKGEQNNFINQIESLTASNGGVIDGTLASAPAYRSEYGSLTTDDNGSRIALSNANVTGSIYAGEGSTIYIKGSNINAYLGSLTGNKGTVELEAVTALFNEVYLQRGATLNLNATDLTSRGKLDISEATLHLINGNNSLTSTGGDITLGTIDNAGNHTLRIAANAGTLKFIVANTLTNSTVSAKDLEITENLTMDGGLLTVSDSTNIGDKTLELKGGTGTHTLGAITGTGTISLSNAAQATATATGWASTGSLSLAGRSSITFSGTTAITVQSLALAGASRMTTNGALTVTNEVNDMNGSIIATGDMAFTGGIATTGTGNSLNAGTHTLTLGASSTLNNTSVTASLLVINGATSTDAGSLLNIANTSTLNAALTINGGTGHELGTTINNGGGLALAGSATAAGGTLSGAGQLTLTGADTTLNLRGNATVGGTATIEGNLVSAGTVALNGSDSMISGTLAAGGDVSIADAEAISGVVTSQTGAITVGGDGKDLSGASMTAANGITINGTNAELADSLALNAGAGNLNLSGLADADGTGTSTVDLSGATLNLSDVVLDEMTTAIHVTNGVNISGGLALGKLVASQLGLINLTGGTLALTGADTTGRTVVSGTGFILNGSTGTLTGLNLDLGANGITALKTGALVLVNTALSGLSMTTEAGTTLRLGTYGSTDGSSTSQITLTGDFVSNGAVAFNDGSSIKANKLTFNGTVTGDVNVESGSDIYLSHVDGKLTLTANNLIDIANGDTLKDGSSLTANNLAIHGTDALTATNTSFAITDTTLIDRTGSLNLVWTTARTMDSLGAVTVSGGTFSATGIAGTILQTKGMTIKGGSMASLNTLSLVGNISTLADSSVDTLNLTNATIANAAINAGDVINMTTSTVTGTLLLDGSVLNVLATGNNTINTLTLANNARVNVNNGASLTVDTTGIGVGADMQINGTVTGNITLMGGTATLANTGTVAGDLGLQGGTLTYNGGSVTGELAFLANPVGNSVISLGSNWTLAAGKALAVNGNGAINMGARNMTSHGLTGTGTLTLNGTGGFTIDATGTHTGDIILNDTVPLIGSAKDAFGTGGTIVANGTHTIQSSADQSKGLTLNNDSTVNLQVLGNTPWTWSGQIQNISGTIKTTFGGSIVFTGNNSNLGTLVLDDNASYGSVQIGNGIDALTMSAGSITGVKSGSKSLTVSSNTTLNAQSVFVNALTVDGTLNVRGDVTTEPGTTPSQTINGTLNAVGDIFLSKAVLGNGSSLHGSSITLGNGNSASNILIHADHDLTLNLGSYGWTNSTVTVQGSMTNNGSLTLSGGDDALYNLGNLINNNSLTLQNNVAVQAASFTHRGTGTNALSIEQGSSLTATGDILSQGKARISGSLTGASITINGTQNTDNIFTGGTLTATAGDITINQIRISTGTMVATGNIDIAGEIYGIWSDAGLSLTSQSGSIDWKVANTVEPLGKAFTSNTSMEAAKDILLNVETRDSNTILKAGGTLYVNANTTLNVSSVSAQATNIANGVSFTLKTNKNSAPVSLGTVTNNGTLELTYGTKDLTVSAESLKGSGNLTIGAWTTLNVTNDIVATGNSTINGILTGRNITLSGSENILNAYNTSRSIIASGDLSITNGVLEENSNSSTTLKGKTVTLAGTFGESINNIVEAEKFNVRTELIWGTSQITTNALTIAQGATLSLNGKWKSNTSVLGAIDNAGNLIIGVDASTSATASSLINAGKLSIGTGSSLMVANAVTSTGSTAVAGTLTGSSITLGGTGNVLTDGTLASASTMTITNATLGNTTLASVTDMTISGTLTDGGNNSLTSSEGSITLNSSMDGADNTITAAKGTVDINAAISGNGLNVTAQDLIIDAALTTTGDNTGRGIITVAGTMDVNAAAALTNVKLDVARTDIIGNGSSLTVTNTGSFGKLGNITIGDHGALTLLGTTAGTKSSLTADINLSNHSTASLTNTTLTGNILVSADANTLTLDTTTVIGNVTLLGSTNSLSMTNSTIGQTLTMDGGQFDLYGANTVGELLLNSTNVNLTLHTGATLAATGKETVIDKNGLYNIEGTHTGDIRISNGTVNLGSTANAGTLDGNLILAYGTLNYNNGAAAITTDKTITLEGDAGFARDINVNATWNASGNTLVANADGTINLAGGSLTLKAIASGTGNLTVNGSNTLTLNNTGAHTGNIVLNGTVNVTTSAQYGLGTAGSLIADTGVHTLTLGRDQSKGLIINEGSTINLTTTRDLQWEGLINNQGTLNVNTPSNGTPLYLTQTGSNLGNLNLLQGLIKLSTWQTAPSLQFTGNAITSIAGTEFDMRNSSLTANSMNLLGSLKAGNGTLALTNGLTAASIDLSGTTVTARSILASATALGANTSLTAVEGLTLNGITALGNNVTLKGGNVSLASASTLTTTGLSLTASHTLALNSGTYTWNNSTVDVHDTTAIAAGTSLTLIGGSNYSLGKLDNKGTMAINAATTASVLSIGNTGTMTIAGTVNSTGAVTSTGKLTLNGLISGTDIALSGGTDATNNTLTFGSIQASGKLDITNATLGNATLRGTLVSLNGIIAGGTDNTINAQSLTIGTDVTMGNTRITASDSTSISAGKTLSLVGGTQSFGSLNGGTGSTLALAGGADAEATAILFANGTIMLNLASSLDTTTAADSTIGNLTLAGNSTLTTAGKLLVTTLADDANGSITSAGDLTLTNGTTTSNTLTLTAGKLLALHGTSYTINGVNSLLSGQTIVVDGALTMNGANSAIHSNGGSITLSGNVSMTGTGSAINAGNDGLITLKGAANTLTNTAVTAGRLNIASGATTLTNGVLTAVTTQVDNGAALTLTGGTTHNIGALVNSGTITLSANTTAQASTVTNNSTLTISGTLNTTGSVVSTGATSSTTINGTLTGSSITLGGTGNVLTNGTLASASTMTITNATLGNTTLASVTDMTISGTLTDGGSNSLTSSDGSITLNAPMTGANNTITAAKGTVDINAAISGNGLNVTAQDLIIDAALTTTGDNAGRGVITVAGTMDVNAAASLTNVTLNVARTDITGNGSSLSVTNTGAFGKLGNVTVDNHGALTLLGTTAGTKSALTADIKVSNNSVASLTNTALTGNILVSADANTLTLNQASVTGNVTLLGTSNKLSMTDSAIDQTLTMDGGQFDLYGANTVGELLLNTTNINLTLHNGATLTATGKETVIDKNGLYLIEGTHTGNIRVNNGTVNLGSADNAGTLDGNLALAYGTLNYDNAASSIATSHSITLTGEAGFARDINVNAAWNASNNTLVANADGTIKLTGGSLTLGAIASGNGKLTVNGTHDLTLNNTGAHTGDIVLNGTVNVTAGATNALGTDGTLVVNGVHTLNVTGDQDKDILLATRRDGLVINNAGNVTLNGSIDSRGIIAKVGAGTLTLEDAVIDNLEANDGLVTSTGDNTFGDLTADGGDITLNTGDQLMADADINATDGTITLNGAKASNGGIMTTTEDGEILVHGGNLKMNEALNDGDMTIDQSARLALNVLTSSGKLAIGSTAAGDRTRVDVATDATLSGDTTINTGSTLDVAKNVDLSGTATIDGTISGKDITIQGNGTSVSGTNGTITADKGLNIGAGAELDMAGNSSVTAGTDITVGGSANVEGSLAAGGNMNVTGDVTVDGTTSVGGSLTVSGDGSVDLAGTANVADKTTINGNGSVDLAATGSSDLGNITANDQGSLSIDGNGNSVTADNIVMNDSASGSITDTVLNLNGGKGEIILNDSSSLDIANTTINGSITTTNTSSTDSTHLGLDKVDINGNLTVVGGDLVLSDNNTVSGSLNISDTVNVTVNDKDGKPGTLVVKEGTTIDPNASLTIDDKSNFTSNVTMTGGSFTINGNAAGNNFNGSIAFKPNDNLTYPGASAPVVNVNGLHNQNMGITVDADASINVNGTLNINGTLSSGSNGDDTLTLNGNGETGEIVINSTNEGFGDDIAIGGGTLVINANEAIGKDGTLSITGTDVTLKNTADGATVSKDIETLGNGLTIQTEQNLTLAGQLDAAGDTITKTGDADLVLSHDPVLNDAKSIIGTLNQNEGNIIVDGTDYTIGDLNMAAGDITFSSLGGNTIHNITAGEGTSISLNATNPAVNGSKADILGDSETNSGLVNLDGSTLETEGTILGLDELNHGTSVNGIGSTATLSNSTGTVTHTTVDTGSELTLDGSTIEGNDLVNSGTTTIKDTTLTLDEAIYIQDGGELNIDGASVIDSDLALSNGTINILAGSSSIITADSTLDFNSGRTRIAGDRVVNVHEDFTMEGSILMTSDGKMVVDAGKTINVNSGFSGSGDLHKEGQGTLTFNKENAAYTGTLHLTEGTLGATASNAYGSTSTLCIHGGGVNVLTGTQNGSPVVFDSGMMVDGDHAFTVNTLSHTTWNGQLSGAKGTMTKLGNSTLAINNANSQSFATAIKVNEGALALNGNIGSDVALSKDTMLSGNGSTAGHVNAKANNTIIEIGEAGKAWTGFNGGVETLTVGSVAFERSEADCMGVYKTGTKTIFDLDLSNSVSDKLVVTGKADLNNSLVEIRKGAYTPTQERSIADGTRFHVVEAGELTGTFHTEVQHDLYLLNAHLENTFTGTDLVLSLNHKGADKNDNQRGISGVIEGIDNDGIATGELLDLVNAFKHTKSEAEAKAALDAAGGTRLSTMMSSMLAGNINHLRTLRGSMGTGNYAITVTPDAKGGMISHGRTSTEVWVTPTHAFNKVNGDYNAPGFSRSAWGAMMGAERSVDANTMLGIALGYDYARTEVMGATDETDTYNIDLYGTYSDGAWNNRASFGIGFHDFTNDRYVSVADRFSHMSRGGTTGTSLNFSYELSYIFQLDDKSTIAPLFTFESTLGWIGSYSEKGDIGNAGLHVDRQDAWATVLGFGGRYTREFTALKNAPAANFEAMALMTFDVGDQGAPVTASFLGAPGRHFTTKPAANSRVGAMLGGGVNIPINDRLTGFGGTTFEFRSGTRDFTANVGVRYTF